MAALLREQKYLGHREIDGWRDNNNFCSIWLLNSLCWQVAMPCLVLYRVLGIQLCCNKHPEESETRHADDGGQPTENIQKFLSYSAVFSPPPSFHVIHDWLKHLDI